MQDGFCRHLATTNTGLSSINMKSLLHLFLLSPNPMHCLPNELLLQHLENFLTDTPLPDDLWVFAYGSLLWNPEMQVVESRHGFVEGYRRGFNLLSTVHRGTPDAPGLVLSLRDGGCCEGVAMRIDRHSRDRDFTSLWLREMVTLFYRPEWFQVDTEQGPVTAIAFVADPEHDQFVDYDCATSAQMIAKAHGGRGPNIDYFNNTHDHLLELGIKDPLFESIAEYLQA